MSQKSLETAVIPEDIKKLSTINHKRIHCSPELETSPAPNPEQTSREWCRMVLGAKIEANKNIILAGVISETTQTYLVSQIPQLQNGVVLWFTENEETKNIYNLLNYWLKNYEIILLNEIKPVSLYKIINNKPIFITGSNENIFLPLPKKLQFIKNFIKLEKGQFLSPAKLSQKLIDLSYEFNRQAETSGEFSRRGGIVDIFLPNKEKPVRIEFFDNRIDNIKEIDLITKKNARELNGIEIIPYRFSEEKNSDIFEYLKNNERSIIIYSEPDILKNKISSWPNIIKKTKDLQTIVFEQFAKKANNLNFKSGHYYHKNFQKFIKGLKKYLKTGWKISIATHKTKELKNLLHKNRINNKNINYLPFIKELTGFLDENNKFLFLTDKEIFGEEILKEKEETSRQRINKAFYMEIRPGDFVVHLDHGIGKFLGMAKNMVDSIVKEYFVIEYAENDKLYVPVDFADKISKYIGISKPKLHRLSGSNWYQITRKVKKEAKILAKELLKLYAQREMIKVKPFTTDKQEEIELEKSFPYPETKDQKIAIHEVKNDLEKETPMDRLICGDVGFGKTEVAIRAALKSVMNNKQVALLSPTTILTQQHYDTFCQRLNKFPVKIDNLSRFQSEKEQKKVVEDIKNGLTDIVIGTHRLLSGDIKFKNLGLIIIDEEQKFGVVAKEKLKSLRTEVHILTLTATPIPRTLNLALSGVRDVSIIETPPEGRLPIETIIEPYLQEHVKKAILDEIRRKGQIYFLYNRVENINIIADQLKKLVPKVKIGVAHGRLPEQELARTMQNFDNRKIDLLVCSTIIENGLDLPNVNTLIVDNASRFGLAQLYQLRGRIGRGARQAFSYFLYHSHKLTKEAKKRLQALLEAKKLGSGFQLALRDLEIRGAGNILGKEQHGKVTAVGLSLYTRLLSQAIEELKTGKIQEPIRDITIDLPIEAYIPKEFLPEEDQRLILYQKMANIINLDELNEFKSKITKQKTLPKQLKNLLNIIELKILSQKTNIISFNTVTISGEGNIKKKRLIIKFVMPYLPEQIKNLLERYPYWILGENQIKTDLENLGNDWVEELKKVVRIFWK